MAHDSQPLDQSALDLSGKVAVITGAARGLGAAIAFAFERCGASLALCDRLADELAETTRALGRPAISTVLDVRDADAVSGFAATVQEKHGGIDILVNNAGGVFHSSMLDVSVRGEAALIAENFTSVTGMVRAFAPMLRPGGSLINVTSVEAFRAAPGFGIYAAMKAAQENLSRTLALELAPRGIRVNTLAPDGLPTPGDEGLADASSRGAREAYANKLPLGFGTPDDIAGPALFLASPLSRYVTGTTIHIDGGSSAACGWVRRPDGTYSP